MNKANLKNEQHACEVNNDQLTSSVFSSEGKKANEDMHDKNWRAQKEGSFLALSRSLAEIKEL